MTKGLGWCRDWAGAVQIFWNAFLSTLAHTGVDAPLLDTDEVRDALQQAADALPEPLHVQVPKPHNRFRVRIIDSHMINHFEGCRPVTLACSTQHACSSVCL